MSYPRRERTGFQEAAVIVCSNRPIAVQPPKDERMTDGFQRVLDHIRSLAGTQAEKGRLFERLMKAYFTADPLYRDRFAAVWLWSEWVALRPDFAGGDTGIDLVAEERGGGFCAIQCKCHAPGTRLSKAHLDSFISASAREPFTARIVVDTGDEWGPNAVKTIAPLMPPCAVLRFGDLASRPVDWPDLVHEAPEALSVRREAFRLRRHQRRAFDDVTRGLAEHDRGKLVMACGTGKTFTALRIAEALAGAGGRVLFLVPSISLFQQSMREWAEQRAVAHRYVGICSDTRAGRNDEDASLQELEIPVTTDPEAIMQALAAAPHDAMTVVFCTYHSLGLVERAQGDGAPAFDLAICDEAHRTTGIERPDDRTSPFVLVHDVQRIRAAKRLYMTATPRLYTEGARAKAARHDVEVFSMDDPETYGPELHRLPFSRAVGQDLLSDYKVVVLAMSESHVDAALQAHLTADGGEINLTDAAKIIGCWRALQSPEGTRPVDGPVRPLRRAIAFTNTIRASKRLEAHWDGIVARAVELLPEGRAAGGVPLRDPPRRRTAPCARPQGANRVAEGLVRRRLPHPIQRPVPVRRHRCPGARRGALHEPAQLPGRHRAGRGPRHAQGRRQGVRLHRAPRRRARGRRPGGGARRQRALRRSVGRAAGASLARRPVRR